MCDFRGDLEIFFLVGKGIGFPTPKSSIREFQFPNEQGIENSQLIEQIKQIFKADYLLLIICCEVVFRRDRACPCPKKIADSHEGCPYI